VDFVALSTGAPNPTDIVYGPWSTAVATFPAGIVHIQADPERFYFPSVALESAEWPDLLASRSAGRPTRSLKSGPTAVAPVGV
jgi:hypothetical protein